MKLRDSENLRMLERFKEYISQRELCGADDTVLLAVSGGVDSMAMLDLFLQSGFKISVAHCNFTLRGEDSEADQQLVESVAQKHNLPIFVARFNTELEASQQGESIQMAARRLRYDFFEKLSKKKGFNRVATAHHGDDSTETFFINLIRGTGLRGLTGIDARSEKYIRPLLFATRSEIESYAAQRALKFHEDRTNRETKYLRNRLRLDILPRISDFVPSFMATMSGNLLRLEQAQQFIDSQMERIKKEVFKGEGWSDKKLVEGEINLDKLLEESSVKENDVAFILFELLYPYGFPPEMIEDMVFSLDRSGKQFHAPNWVATIDRKRILINPSKQSIRPSETIYENDSRIEWITLEELESYATPLDVALLTADNIEFPLTLRLWRSGDTFVPLGMEGNKKVSDFLIDEKVSMPEKERQMILTSASGEILWIVGRRIDNRFRVTEHSQRIIRLRLL